MTLMILTVVCCVLFLCCMWAFSQWRKAIKFQKEMNDLREQERKHEELRQRREKEEQEKERQKQEEQEKERQKQEAFEEKDLETLESEKAHLELNLRKIRMFTENHKKNEQYYIERIQQIKPHYIQQACGSQWLTIDYNAGEKLAALESLRDIRNRILLNETEIINLEHLIKKYNKRIAFLKQNSEAEEVGD